MVEHLKEVFAKHEAKEEKTGKPADDSEMKFTLNALAKAHKAGTKPRGIVKGDSDGDESC
jgi:hypothetical protein